MRLTSTTAGTASSCTQRRQAYDRALPLLRQVGDRRAEGVALANLAVLEQLAGNLDASLSHHERALERLATVGDERSEGLCLARLGSVQAQLGAARCGPAGFRAKRIAAAAVRGCRCVRRSPTLSGILGVLGGRPGERDRPPPCSLQHCARCSPDFRLRRCTCREPAAGNMACKEPAAPLAPGPKGRVVPGRRGGSSDTKRRSGPGADSGSSRGDSCRGPDAHCRR